MSGGAGQANLEYATNAELIEELQHRWELGFRDPDYSTGVPGLVRTTKCRCGMFEVPDDDAVTLDVMKHTAQACFTVDRHGHPT